MQNQSISTRRGNVIAFLLMGLIAVLAIVVGLLSRANRNKTVEATTAVHAPSEVTTSSESIPSPAAEMSSDTTASEQFQFPPPPPPAFQTPDPATLPPEG